MHSTTVSELDGTFQDPKPVECKCPKCGSPMTVQEWESSCGGHDDEKYTCTNKACGHFYWIEGSDS